MDEAILTGSIRYIETNLKEKINVSLIAGSVGYSEYHFSRLFHEAMGCSVMEYVRKRRIYRASEDIIDGKKIIDAAYEYGWQSHNSFTRAFKAEYGFPPSFLRAMYMTLASGGMKMGQITCVRLSEDLTKEELLVKLRETLSENAVAYDEKELSRMYALCCQVYDGMRRYSGSEYVTHPLHVAILLADMGAEENVVYAGMFCDARKKTEEKNLPISKEIVSKEIFSKEIWNLINTVNTCEDLGEIKDERAVLIKLAERLHNMRTVEFMDEDRAGIKARETFDVFLPMARKLKNEKLVSELNDLSVKYI